MEQRLHEILMDGEQVRWTGRPSPFKLMQCPERKTFFATWLLSGAAAGSVLSASRPGQYPARWS